MPIRFSSQLNNYTLRVNRILNTRRKDSLLKATIAWHEGVVEELSGNRSGRQYKVPGTGRLALEPRQVTFRKGPRSGKTYTIHYNVKAGARLYKASRPGEAPAVRLGQLRQSYRFQVVGPNYMERGEVGSPLDRALYLEKGTKRIKPRPHLEPAYFKKKNEILAALGQRLDD
jgi:hypothetical protein